MPSDKVTLDIESFDPARPGSERVLLAIKGGVKTQYILDYNPADIADWLRKKFMEVKEQSATVPDGKPPVFLYPNEMHLAHHFEHSHDVHEIVMNLGDICTSTIDPRAYDAITPEVETELKASLSRMQALIDDTIRRAFLNGDFYDRPVDIDIGDVVAAMKASELRALPHEPHRSYDWRQRLSPRKRKHRK